MSKDVPADFGLELELFLLGEGRKIGHNDQEGHQQRKDLDAHWEGSLLYVLINYCIKLVLIFVNKSKDFIPFLKVNQTKLFIFNSTLISQNIGYGI